MIAAVFLLVTEVGNDLLHEAQLQYNRWRYRNGPPVPAPAEAIRALWSLWYNP